jgi:nitrite reductase/ring-hydroxylating ferredoxin subunit
MLVEGGRGIRFYVHDGENTMPAFVIRYAGRVRAYINRCSHMGLQLDFTAGSFLDNEKQYIICATHGALYDPVTGACRFGPCNGTGLIALAVTERDGRIMLNGEHYQLASIEKTFEE